MLHAYINDVIETLADFIAGIGVATAESQQARLDTLEEYKTRSRQLASGLLSSVVSETEAAVRNRFADYLAHPRLGHEPLAAELKASEIGMNEAVVALNLSPTTTNHALAIAASIRLSAITQVLGVACIYCGPATQAATVKPKRDTKKPARAGDKRLRRREPTINDIPVDVRPLVAQLSTSNPGRIEALGSLQAQRGGPHDIDGIVTRLVALATLIDAEELIETLAAQAGESGSGDAPSTEPVETADPICPPVTTRSSVPASETKLFDDAFDTRATPASATPKAAISAAGTVDPQPSANLVPSADVLPPIVETTSRTVIDTDKVAAAIALVAGFVEKNRWALIGASPPFKLRPLQKRADINQAFDRMANLPAMQDALARVHAAPLPRRSAT